MNNYLQATEIINWGHPAILAKAKELAATSEDQISVVKSSFIFVRDCIKHIADHDIDEVFCNASDVLQGGAGICYAKSHLLAALLRANAIPAGFCYQRLRRDDELSPFCLHGLNAVYLTDYGWYRIDARGNKEGVNAYFAPPVEYPAFSIKYEGEVDFSEIWADPLPVVVDALRSYKTRKALWSNLPDISV